MPFPFLLLPGEIRNRIYGLCLCPDKEVVINTNKTETGGCFSSVSPTAPKSPGQRLALLLANKQINREAMPYFFAENTFRFFCNSDSAIEDVFDAAVTYLDGLSSERRNLMRRIRVGITFDGFMILQEGDFRDFAEVLHAASNLRHLEVNITMETCRCRRSEKLSEHVESFLLALDTGVHAKISLWCYGSVFGSGIAGWQVDHKILGWRHSGCSHIG